MADLRKNLLAAGLISCVSSSFVLSNSQMAFAMKETEDLDDDDSKDGSNENKLDPKIAKEVGLSHGENDEENKIIDAVIELLSDNYVKVGEDSPKFYIREKKIYVDNDEATQVNKGIENFKKTVSALKENYKITNEIKIKYRNLFSEIKNEKRRLGFGGRDYWQCYSESYGDFLILKKEEIATNSFNTITFFESKKFDDLYKKLNSYCGKNNNAAEFFDNSEFKHRDDKEFIKSLEGGFDFTDENDAKYHMHLKKYDDTYFLRVNNLIQTHSYAVKFHLRGAYSNFCKSVKKVNKTEKDSKEGNVIGTDNNNHDINKLGNSDNNEISNTIPVKIETEEKNNSITNENCETINKINEGNNLIDRFSYLITFLVTHKIAVTVAIATTTASTISLCNCATSVNRNQSAVTTTNTVGNAGVAFSTSNVVFTSQNNSANNNLGNLTMVGASSGIILDQLLQNNAVDSIPKSEGQGNHEQEKPNNDTDENDTVKKTEA